MINSFPGSLVRPNIARLEPYVCARQISQDGVLLDANENSFGSAVPAIMPGALNRYPDPNSADLKRELSKYLGVPVESLFVGVGSDEVIDILMRVFVNPGDEIVSFEPTYGMYRVAGEINDAVVKTCLLTADFQLDLDDVAAMLSDKTKIAFCASPNSPTGNLLRESDIETLCGKFRGIVVVDEAYIEFASKESLVGKVKIFENLVVIRTFSKAWGLAGLRVGYCVANPEIVRFLNKIKPPYNLNRLSARYAIAALQNVDAVMKMKGLIVAERMKLANDLTALGLEVFDSEANFLLVRVANASRIVRLLSTRFGLVVRDFSSRPLLRDCFRVTVGTPDQNRLFIDSLAKLL